MGMRAGKSTAIAKNKNPKNREIILRTFSPFDAGFGFSALSLILKRKITKRMPVKIYAGTI
jgi:hypothetical protein